VRGALRPRSKKNGTSTCKISEICWRRLALIRFAPFSYFCTCWNAMPRASPSCVWDLPSIMRRSALGVLAAASLRCIAASKTTFIGAKVSTTIMPDMGRRPGPRVSGRPIDARKSVLADVACSRPPQLAASCDAFRQGLFIEFARPAACSLSTSRPSALGSPTRASFMAFTASRGRTRSASNQFRSHGGTSYCSGRNFTTTRSMRGESFTFVVCRRGPVALTSSIEAAASEAPPTI
jgi:hypothetical protein